MEKDMGKVNTPALRITPSTMENGTMESGMDTVYWNSI